MKKNGKKLITLIIVGCMSTVSLLTGCGIKDKTDTDSEADNQYAVVSQTPKTKTANTEAPKEKSNLVVTLSKSSGVYKKGFNLDITCEGAKKIYYTTDGSDPATSKTRIQYTKPVKVTDRSNEDNYVTAVDPFLFDGANVKVNSAGNGFKYTLHSKPSNEAVDKCTVIRAAAIDEKGLYTEVATNTYFIGSMAEHIQGIKESCKAAGTSLSVISLSMNYDDLFDSKTGIYVKGDIYDKSLKDFLNIGKPLEADTSRRLEANYTQRGKEWERNVHMDYFESDGKKSTLGLSQDCGIRIQGNYSRSDLQKGFRLCADKDYGKKNFEYAFFGDNLKNDSKDTINKFKTLTLRAGGNCAFTTKYSDTYWQTLVKDLKCDTQTSRPCIVYIDGEYWGLYVLQEDYSQQYFENKHGVNKDDVILYKGDAEKYDLGYKLDLGELPQSVTDESYYFKELLDFFSSHEDLSNDADYEEFARLVDVESARDYYATEIWMNNKWDWPGKNWSMWKTAKVDKSNPYADGRWRFCFYDVEFGGVMGAGEAKANTIKEDNYETYGLLDKATKNTSVMVYIYLMSNEKFREDFAKSLQSLSKRNFEYKSALAALNVYKNTYGPLYDQFFDRYPESGSKDNSINGEYASYKCIKDFLEVRAGYIQPMLDYINQFYK